MFINGKGDWECELCGAAALMYGYHREGCPVFLMDSIFDRDVWRDVRITERLFSFFRSDGVMALADVVLMRVELIRDGYAPVFLSLDGGTRDAIERVQWMEIQGV